MIKQVVAVLQGPKSKTHVRIVFKLFEGFTTYLAYINSIKQLKNACMGESANNYERNVLKNQNCKLIELGRRERFHVFVSSRP